MPPCSCRRRFSLIARSTMLVSATICVALRSVTASCRRNALPCPNPLRFATLLHYTTYNKLPGTPLWSHRVLDRRRHVEHWLHHGRVDTEGTAPAWEGRNRPDQPGRTKFCLARLSCLELRALSSMMRRYSSCWAGRPKIYGRASPICRMSKTSI